MGCPGSRLFSWSGREKQLQSESLGKIQVLLETQSLHLDNRDENGAAASSLGKLGGSAKEIT